MPPNNQDKRIMTGQYNNSIETRQRLFERNKDELVAKQIANSTSFDTAVLTLSSAFLALSITFIKDVVAPLSEASALCLLYVSWILHCLALISTVASFMVGQSSYRALIAAAERYYLKEEADAYNVSVTTAKRLETLNNLNGGFFILGTVVLLVFVIANFNRLANTPIKSAEPPLLTQQYQPAERASSAPNPSPLTLGGEGASSTDI
jgi:hypothetical protein